MRKSTLFSLAILFLSTIEALCQTVCLDGVWDFRFEEGKTLEDISTVDFNASDKMVVPGCFDVMQPYYRQRGTALYRKTICLNEAAPDAIWEIDGIGLRGVFYVDGKQVGYSAIPYSHIEFPTGPLAAGNHEFTAAIDNMLDHGKMKLFLPNYDFYAFGGFYRGMSLTIWKEKVQLDRVLVRTLDYKNGKVSLELGTLGGKAFPQKARASVSFDGKPWTEVVFVDSRAEMTVPDFKLWSTEAPNLHSVRVKYRDVTIQSRFGIRTVETRGKDILLNGKKIYLQGVNRHESHPSFGSATPKTLMQADIALIKSLGANFVRGAHYSQSQDFLDLCDENGLLVWEESLGWGNKASQMSDSEFISLQEQQTRTMVRRSFNHPSVIIFAFLNENKSNTPEGKALIDDLIGVIRSEDSGRLVSFACNQVDAKNTHDLGHQNTDIVSFNSYPAWIDAGRQAGSPEHMKSVIARDVQDMTNHFRKLYPDKPIIVSEMGTCGIYGQRDDAAAQWTEDFQAEYVGNVIDAVFAEEDITGLAIWHFADAPSYLRDGASVRVKPLALNLAGLYDQYRRPKAVTHTIRDKFRKRGTCPGNISAKALTQ